MPTKTTILGRGSESPQVIDVSDLTGGLDLRASPTQLDADRARRLRNWSTEEPGAVIVERGTVDWLDPELADSRLQGGERIYLNDNPFTLLAQGGNIYKATDEGDPGSPVHTGLSTTHEIDFFYDRHLVVAVDGANAPVKSEDGTSWTALGIPSPPVAPVATAVAGGSLITGNNYEVSYAFRSATDTGNESVVDTQIVSGANLTVRVTVTGTTRADITTLVAYARNLTTGEQVRREAGTVANPGATTAVIDLTIENWDENDEAFTSHNLPEPLRFGTFWKNRFWGASVAVGNRLYFTELFLGQAWPALYYVDIPFLRGDKLEAMIPLGDTLILFGKTSLVLIFGQTSLDFEVRPALGPQDGALGFRAIADVEGQIAHAGATGIFSFDGATDRLLTYDIEPGWRDMVKGSLAADLAKTPMVYHKAGKCLRVGTDRLYPYNTPGEWKLDLSRTRDKERPVWTSTSRDVGGYVHWDGDEPDDGDRERIFAWSTRYGHDRRTRNRRHGGDQRRGSSRRV